MRVRANDRELWVDIQGSGAPVIVLPGGPGLACDYLEPLASLLRPTHTVVLFDPRGCGRSSRHGPYGVGALLADVEGIRRELGHPRWRVVGHSFGADLALAYAVTFAESVVDVHALAPTGIQNDRDWHRAYEAARGQAGDDPPLTAYPVDASVARETLESWREWIKGPHVLRQIAELPARYVAVVGTEDIRPAWPVAQVAMLAPRGDLVVIDGAGHEPWTHAAELSELLGRT